MRKSLLLTLIALAATAIFAFGCKKEENAYTDTAATDTSITATDTSSTTITSSTMTGTAMTSTETTGTTATMGTAGTETTAPSGKTAGEKKERQPPTKKGKSTKY